MYAVAMSNPEVGGNNIQSVSILYRDKLMFKNTFYLYNLFKSELHFFLRYSMSKYMILYHLESFSVEISHSIN